MVKWVKKSLFLLQDGDAIPECHFGDVDIIINIITIPSKSKITMMGEKATLSESNTGHVDIIIIIKTYNLWF